MTVGAPPVIRVRGELRALENYPPLNRKDTRDSIYSILSNDQRKRLEQEWQVDFSYSVPGARPLQGQRLHAARLGRRRIPSDSFGDQVHRSAGAAGGDARIREEAARVRARHRADRFGQVHLAGGDDRRDQPTRKEHILTIEDPIEFLHRHKSCVVNQREIGNDAQSFSLGLKAALRQDPDVILVGEMRDLETISTALTAAETGHLVFATLHTQDTAQTIDRIIDVFPPHQQQQVRVQLSVRSRRSSPSNCSRLPTAPAASHAARCSG